MTGRLIRVGEARRTGVEDIPGFLSNFGNVGKYLQKAFKDGYYIEYISLQIQLVDFLLRILVTNNNDNISYKLEDKKNYFGKILFDAKEYLPKDLYMSLSDYNKVRIDIIHKFIFGKISEIEIRKKVREYKNIHFDVFNCVLASSKEIFSKIPLAKANEHVIYQEISQK